jgi:hypothetical protein
MRCISEIHFLRNILLFTASRMASDDLLPLAFSSRILQVVSTIDLMTYTQCVINLAKAIIAISRNRLNFDGLKERKIIYCICMQTASSDIVSARL